MKRHQSPPTSPKHKKSKTSQVIPHEPDPEDGQDGEAWIKVESRKAKKSKKLENELAVCILPGLSLGSKAVAGLRCLNPPFCVKFLMISGNPTTVQI